MCPCMLDVIGFYTDNVSYLKIIKPLLTTVRAASCNGRVHLFVCSSVCLSRKYKNAIFSKTSNLEPW